MLAASYPAPIEQVMTPFDRALVRERRQKLLVQARGRVLELGGSGGANLDHYPANAVVEVVVAGSEDVARSRLQRAATRSALPVRVVPPGEAGTGFDTIVAVFTLSGQADLDRVLRELSGALAEDGRLLFLDHSPRRPPGLTTELSRPFLRLIGSGFVPGRDLPGAIRRSGFTVLALERFGLPTLTLPLRSCVAGVARLRRPGGAHRPKEMDAPA
jgi:SAM-dependent methyltransferase